MTANSSDLSLAFFQEEWLKLFARMIKEPILEPGSLAAPFLTVAPDGYTETSAKRILYVGKATAGDWYLDKFLEKPTIEERRERTKLFLDAIRKREYKSPFWRFAEGLCRAGSVSQLPNSPELSNLVWSNICKIGVLNGNPEGPYQAIQVDLATETLLAEIKTYRPSLIVFVTWNYAEEVVHRIVDDSNDLFWEKEGDHNGFWYRRPRNSLPAILWTKHPERKTKLMTNLWLDVARSLLF
jgi:hypothetical protein